jgi:hypothetical protein
MTQEENDRLIEILFYLYFNNKDQKILSSNLFWTVIKSICTLYGINDRAVVQSVRVLMADENCPEEKETYYLLSKIGLTVRPIRNISGIYWQKQKAFAEEFVTIPPVIKRRLTDVIYKRSIRDFVYAVYDINGIFNYVDKDLIFGKGV